MSEQEGFGQPGETTAQEGVTAPTVEGEGQDTPEGVEGSQEATQPHDAGESATERRARLQRELEEVQADVDAENAERLANADESDLCPTCGQLPPPADPPIGAREIWCPDCGQKLANLPAGH